MDVEISASSQARAQIEGEFGSYVTSPQRPLQTIVKTAATLGTRREISVNEFRDLLQRVYEDSVEPFLKPPWTSGSERHERFDQLRGSLAAAQLI